MNKARTRFAGTLAVALVAGLALSATSAWAVDIGHSYSFSFEGSGTNALVTPTSADVDNSTGPSSGDVYVTDSGAHRVEKFDADGNFILMFGDEVNATTHGDVCLSGESCKAGNTGTAADQLTTPNWLAVDQSSGPSKGDIYVADAGDNTVHKYTEAGALVTGWGTGGSIDGSTVEGPFNSLIGVDVDSSGNLVVANNPGAPPTIWVISESGSLVSKFEFGGGRGNSNTGFAISPDGYLFKTDGSPDLQRAVPGGGANVQISNFEFSSTTGIAVDPVTGTAYQANGSGVIAEYKFNPAGVPLDSTNGACTETLVESGGGCAPTHTFGAGQFNGALGIGVASAENIVYVADSGNHQIDVFVAAQAAKVTTEEPVANTTVSGSVDPDGAGEVVECFFEYGKATAGPIAYTNTKACSPAPNYTAATPVTAELAGLEGEQDYHYRLVAKNIAGATNYGSDKIITPHNVKGLKTEDATGVIRTEAELHASFEGDGTPTTYYFEWGPSASPYSEKSVVSSAGSPSFPPRTNLSLQVENLAPQTVYHFRVAAENATGFSPGKDRTFETLPAVPGLVTGVSSDITQESFTLHGEFAGNGEDTHYYFEYGPTAAYGEKFPVPEADAGSPSGAATVSYVITEFTGYTSYHYRIVATNPVGKTFGQDETVTTLPAPLPSLTVSGPTDVGTTEATVHAEIAANHWDTIYRVQYGTDASYGDKTLASASIGTSPVPRAVSETLTGLQPGTTYHYRVQATNFTGTSYGPDQTFTTHSAPAVSASTATATGQTTARLSAEVVANGDPTSVQFSYGSTAAYGQASAALSIGSAFVGQSVSTDLSGLLPGTTYHVKVVATNARGIATGSDLTFTTDPAPIPREEVTPPPKCKKGFVRKNGKCVKKHKKKQRKHHKSGAKA